MPVPATGLREQQGAAHARLLGIGAYRPSRLVPNSEVVGAIDSSDEWIRQRSGIETRRWATPESVRSRSNPVEPTEAVLEQALAHYADHCAACHANNGSGETTMGRSMYPRVPDMRIEKTQSLSDGELFSIIEHGIRLTGMPGWGNGTPEGERESWGLVHFVRRLPKLTDEDIERMEALNPKSPAQFKEEEEARRFLEGATVKPAGASPKDRRH